MTSDPLTGRTDGLMARCLTAGNCPKIIKTDTELEFYQGRASLVATDTQGNALAMPDNVRLFLLSNLQHAAPANAKSEMTRTCMFPSNPLYAGPPLRALLTAMEAWITRAAPPPASRYPSRADGTLVEPTAVGFPQIPGVTHFATMNRAVALDERTMPPTRGKAYPVFLPRTDADGRNLAGICLPSLEAPVATHMGWNYRKAGFGEGELCDNTGSMIPFARTREERLKAGDPRLSLEERYRGSERADAMGRLRENWSRTGCCSRRTRSPSSRRSTNANTVPTLYDKIWHDHVVDEAPRRHVPLYVDRHILDEVDSPQAFGALRLPACRCARRRRRCWWSTTTCRPPTATSPIPIPRVPRRSPIWRRTQNCSGSNISTSATRGRESATWSHRSRGLRCPAR